MTCGAGLPAQTVLTRSLRSLAAELAGQPGPAGLQVWRSNHAEKTGERSDGAVGYGFAGHSPPDQGDGGGTDGGAAEGGERVADSRFVQHAADTVRHAAEVGERHDPAAQALGPHRP